MAQAKPTRNEQAEIVDRFLEWYRQYYRDEIGQLAQRYPQDQRSLVVEHSDLYSYDPELADDWIDHPDQFQDIAEEALRQFDLPADVPLDDAHVRMAGLGETYTVYPDEFSPTDAASEYRTVRGDVLVTTEPYSVVTTAAFECQRCGTLTRIPQSGDWQEPHECQGCDRQGPFKINYEQSAFVDGQTIQLQTPPERASGTGRTLQVFVRDDAVDQVEMGDRIAASGILHLNQQSQNGQKQGEFEPYMKGHHIAVEESNSADLDIDAETRERVEDLADGAEGEPLDVVAESFAPEVHGYADPKKALALAIVGGATQTPDLRGMFHVLLIGDPSTSKSILIGRANELAARSLAADGKGSSSAGLTSTATQGEFSDGRWTLQPGALVKASGGVLTIDELDDMPGEDRKSLLKPMADQVINVSKAGINATLSTQTAVLAASNPKYGRFDPYEPLADQFVFDSNLISRFDLVFTFRDQPEESGDREIADHMTRYRDGQVREHRGVEVPDAQAEATDQPVSDEILQAWLALAKRQPDPYFADEGVREELRDKFVTMRGMNGYDDDDEVPVTFRKLPGVERVARAIAKLEFSPVVETRHAEQAMALVGSSLQDYQKTEEGTLDADISETGESQSQKDRKQAVADTIRDLQTEGDKKGAAVGDVVDKLTDEYEESTLRHDIRQFIQTGEASEPRNGRVRYFGRL
ncbi:replicative DNA helicase Mcm [Halorientalis persicus]|uniref:DNA helicase n=1 Tax=Halorientalis persicus TaxID=1367881 RepID=A0A1H8RUD4_9EURY|nr:minichromosome maintenance protein MCM [Halorientalis persicus]SEO69955.1 replicative DNA helicase Mcm [Halorientalis persicus]